MKKLTEWYHRCRLLFLCVCFTALTATPKIIAAGLEESSLSKMECNYDKNGDIVCQVLLDKASATDWRLEHCFENNGPCLEATIASKSKREETSTKEDKKTDELEESAATRMDTETKPGPTILFATENNLVIGSRTYTPPFEQYGSEVSKALHRISRLFPQKTNDIDLAAEFSILAMAHRGETSGHESSNAKIPDIDLEGAINAFEESLRLYERALPKLRNVNDRDDINQVIGATATMLAEGYQLHSDKPQFNKALEYYRKAEATFNQLLEDAVSRLDVQTLDDVELRWADTATRMGVLLMERAQEGPTEPTLSTSTSNHFQVDEILDTVEEGKELLKGAEQIYRIAANRDDVDAETKRDHQYMLANNLHSSGSASLLLARSSDAIQEWEEALRIYEDLSSLGDPHTRGEYLSLAAELSYSLSDTYLQMGMYDEVNSHYDKAMKLFSLHGAPDTILSGAVVDIMDADEMLQIQEDSLREYHESLYGGHEVQIPDDYRDADEPHFQADELYEAQLHSTIGSLKMSGNDMENALGHFQKALELYADNIDGQDRFIADMHLNIAILYLFFEDYEESSRQHREAVEIYRAVTKNGKNPLVDEELLEELKGSLPGLFGRGKADATQGQPDRSSRDTVLDRLIDVGEYTRGLMNRTKVVAVPDADEL